MYSFEQFKRSRWSLVALANGRVVYRSRGRALKPLTRLHRERQASWGDLTIYDEYVGRAAALLTVLLHPVAVHTPIVSEAGEAVLREHGVELHSDKRVKWLMGVASEGMCEWEKLSMEHTPESFLELVTKRRR